jgi:methionine sulfoxide reductase catalytic subunit
VIRPSEITPEAQYFDRRRSLVAGVSVATLALLGRGSSEGIAHAASESQSDPRFRNVVISRFSIDESVTPIEAATTKTRFRELEEDIAKNGEAFVPHPWQVAIEGECLRPRVYDIDELLRLAPLEERIYRMLCTEGWLHVVPYIGYPLAELLKRVEPTGNAKFVEFTSINRPQQLRGQREITYISWPYVEGLRIDEAMHPLTLVALGAYGRMLPKGLGAPIAVRVPWKFGTKSPKSIVRIRLMATQPATVWNTRYPTRHSFWGNVNPVGATNLLGRGQRERKEGDLLTRPTPLYNGYADHVAALYAGMDPKAMF